MKRLLSIFLLLAAGSMLLAQEPVRQSNPQWFPDRTHDPNQLRWDDFYEQNGTGRINMGAGYVGSSVAYFQKGSGRLLYGLNIDLLAVETVRELLPNRFVPVYRETALIVPLWLTLKIRLLQQPHSTLSPYLISGIGPTWGLRIHNDGDFFDALGSIQGQIGAGGFVGAGIDYLWAEDWALSMDVRYNVIRFDNPLGLEESYDGFSFSIGFMRAFDW